MTVSDMMSKMSALEETYWLARFKDNPWGDHRADIRNAQVLQLLYNVHASKKAPKKQLSDWLPFHRKRIKEDPDVSTKVRDLFGNIIKHQKGK